MSKSTLETAIASLEWDELLELHAEGVRLWESGVLPDNSRVRSVALTTMLGSTDAWALTRVTHAVNRRLAAELAGGGWVRVADVRGWAVSELEFAGRQESSGGSYESVGLYEGRGSFADDLIARCDGEGFDGWAPAPAPGGASDAA